MDDLLGLILWGIFARIFVFRPVVRKEGQLLIARSDWRSQLFSLGFGGRKLSVDPMSRILRLKRRSFWFFTKSRRIEFDWVEEILYGYSDVAGSFWSHRSQDLFTVSLQLKNEQEVILFRFFGQGEFINQSFWPDWVYWSEDLVTPLVRGSQETESMLFCDVLSRMIGVPIGNPV